MRMILGEAALIWRPRASQHAEAKTGRVRAVRFPTESTRGRRPMRVGASFWRSCTINVRLALLSAPCDPRRALPFRKSRSSSDARPVSIARASFFGARLLAVERLKMAVARTTSWIGASLDVKPSSDRRA